MKNKNKKPVKIGKSRFASKYQERIKSIKNTNKNININKDKELKTNFKEKQEINHIKENDKNLNSDILEEINNNIETSTDEIKPDVLKIKNYEQIRQEMLKKFNNKARN